MGFSQITVLDEFVKQLHNILESHIKDKDTEIRKLARRLYNSGYSEGYHNAEHDSEGKDVDLKEEIKNRIDSLSNLYCYMEDLFNGNEEEGVYPIPEKVTNELLRF